MKGTLAAFETVEFQEPRSFSLLSQQIKRQEREVASRRSEPSLPEVEV